MFFSLGIFFFYYSHCEILFGEICRIEKRPHVQNNIDLHCHSNDNGISLFIWRCLQRCFVGDVVRRHVANAHCIRVNSVCFGRAVVRVCVESHTIRTSIRNKFAFIKAEPCVERHFVDFHLCLCSGNDLCINGIVYYLFNLMFNIK